MTSGLLKNVSRKIKMNVGLSDASMPANIIIKAEVHKLKKQNVYCLSVFNDIYSNHEETALLP